MLHMASRSLQHWLNVGVSQNWLSFSHFPREAKQMKCGEKIVDGQFLPFHPRSVYLAFGHHSNNSCLACWVVQFDGTAWLKAGLCHKYTFYYMDLTMPPKKSCWFFEHRPDLFERSKDSSLVSMAAALIWSDALFGRPRKDFLWGILMMKTMIFVV